MAISDCRGQGFDNGANMSGKVKGVQAEIKKINPLATYSPCASHSLNLVGVQAAESCPDVSTFFGCLNRLYSLFKLQVQSVGQSLKVRLAAPFNVCQRPGGVHA